MINNICIIFFLLINNIQAISAEGGHVLREFREHALAVNSEDKLGLRIAQLELIHVIMNWEKWRGIRYSRGMKSMRHLVLMYSRLIATRKIT